jgi:hypothetical protein
MIRISINTLGFRGKNSRNMCTREIQCTTQNDNTEYLERTVPLCHLNYRL